MTWHCATTTTRVAPINCDYPFLEKMSLSFPCTARKPVTLAKEPAAVNVGRSYVRTTITSVRAFSRVIPVMRTPSGMTQERAPVVCLTTG